MADRSGTSSFVQLYMSLRRRLARSVVGIVPPGEIEDILQEAYVRVCQVENVASIRTPQSYLFRTVRNLALDYSKRAESRLTDSLSDDGDDGVGFDAGHLADQTFEQVASNEEFTLFCDAVRHLPVQCRRAFVLRKVYGYSQREIAAELNLSESTVEKHIALGIKRCTHFIWRSDEQHRDAETCERDDARSAMKVSKAEGKS